MGKQASMGTSSDGGSAAILERADCNQPNYRTAAVTTAWLNVHHRL